MKNLISRKSHFQKSVVMTSIVFLLVLCLFVFNKNKNPILSFRPYYLQSYFFNLFDQGNRGKDFAMVLGSSEQLNKEYSDNSNNDNAKSVPVILYHALTSENDKSNVTLNNFIDQMYQLKKAGWSTVTLEDFVEFIKGKKILPERSFLLTFDDGRRDSYYPADPVLEKLEFNAVMFVISSRMKFNSNHLSVSELKEMTDSARWEIQSHGHAAHDLVFINKHKELGNYLSNKLWQIDSNLYESDDNFIERISRDFLTSKELIQDSLNNNVYSYAYPFGDFGHMTKNFPNATEIINSSIRNVYSMAFYQVWSGLGNSFNYPNPDPFFVKRISVSSNWTGVDLLNTLERQMEKNLPYNKEILRISDGWQKNWGEYSDEKNGLLVYSSPNANGSVVFLEGTYSWKNYDLNAQVDWLKGKSFGIIARHINEDYVFCNYSENGLSVYEVIGGKAFLIDSINIKGIHHGYKLNVGLSLDNEKIFCYWGNEMLGSKLNSKKKIGGIGFKTWDPVVGESELIIRNINVSGSISEMNDLLMENIYSDPPKHGLDEE